MRCDACRPGWQVDANRLRGEFVLVLHAPAPAGDETASAAHDRVLDALLAGAAAQQAVAAAVELTGADWRTGAQRASGHEPQGRCPTGVA